MTWQMNNNLVFKIYELVYQKPRIKKDVKQLRLIFSKYNVKRILEVGCGSGWHGKLLSQYFSVTLSDVENNLAENVKLPFVKLDLLSLDRVGVFDAAYAIDVIDIFPPEELDKVFKTIWHNLSYGGIFVFTFSHKYVKIKNKDNKIDLELNGKKYTLYNVYTKFNNYLVGSCIVFSENDFIGSISGKVYIHKPEEIERSLSPYFWVVEKIPFRWWIFDKKLRIRYHVYNPNSYMYVVRVK